MHINAYGSEILDNSGFRATRAKQLLAMGQDNELRKAALALQANAEVYGYGYQQQWCGVPVIRLPDDILILQEIVWDIRPGCIVETGVARGGGLVLSASLMAMAQLQPRVLGLDIQVLDHARSAIVDSPYAPNISVWEGDSASGDATIQVANFLASKPDGSVALMILDSNHTHDHVLKELRAHARALPLGSMILVADTLIEEFAANHYPHRPWDKGNNPKTAVDEFLASDSDFILSQKWCRRGLVTEFRDGIIVRAKS